MLNMIKSNYSPRFIQALHLFTKIFSELEFFISNGMLFQMIAPEYVKLFLNKLSFGLGTKKFLLATERKLEIVSSDTFLIWKKVQVGKDQEKAQSEKDSHSKNRGGKKPN